MSRKNESVTLSLSVADQKELEKIAMQMDCTWGKKGNISALMRAIADGNLAVVKDGGSGSSSPSVKQKREIRGAIAKLQKVLGIENNS